MASIVRASKYVLAKKPCLLYPIDGSCLLALRGREMTLCRLPFACSTSMDMFALRRRAIDGAVSKWGHSPYPTIPTQSVLLCVSERIIFLPLSESQCGSCM